MSQPPSNFPLYVERCIAGEHGALHYGVSVFPGWYESASQLSDRLWDMGMRYLLFSGQLHMTNPWVSADDLVDGSHG